MSTRSKLVEEALGSMRASRNGWLRGPCLFCEMDGHVDRKLSFGISPRGIYSCFRCGVKGKVDVPEDLVTSRAPEPGLEREARQPPDGFVALSHIDGSTAESTRPARLYLRRRNVGPQLTAEAGIGACVSGRYFGRVVVPVLDPDGAWCGWVGRSWVDGGDKPYLYPPGEWRGAALYNSRALRVETDRPVFVVEGVFDALALWPDAVAVLGKPSEAQVQALLGALRPVVVALDGDAWREGQMLAKRLRFRGQRAGYVRLPPGVDPDEVARSKMDQLAELALS